MHSHNILQCSQRTWRKMPTCQKSASYHNLGVRYWAFHAPKLIILSLFKTLTILISHPQIAMSCWFLASRLFSFVVKNHLGKVKLEPGAGQQSTCKVICGGALWKSQRHLFLLPLLACLHFARYSFWVVHVHALSNISTNSIISGNLISFCNSHHPVSQKHSKECFIQFPDTSELVRNIDCASDLVIVQISHKITTMTP